MMAQGGFEMESETDVRTAMTAVIQACASVRHELNDLESAAWLAAVESFTPQAVMKFLLSWMSTNSRKAPTVADLRRAVDPTFVDEESALERLYLLVSRTGPWNTPSASELGPMLCRAIDLMGGWARVNEIMPDRSDRFAWSAFADRFLSSFGTAQSQAFQQSLLAPEHRTEIPAPLGLHALASRAAPSNALSLGASDSKEGAPMPAQS
ncbi:MAG: hypothetical protein EPN79_11050 [Burkholderiaceae bacterium]|nr:MAG: hypothetical protein EPN79_11050 [Burkholderiaceae bacterium]TBR76779.1 MAG: hypothetical protein EPN64_06025 [Burkholderiaceae bacterium]